MLTIYWPHQLYSENSKKDKWLLYLEGLPIIDGVRQGECLLAPGYINPLKLKSKTNTDPLLEQLLLAPAPYMMRPNSNKTQFNSLSRYTQSEKASYSKYSKDANLNRVRRDMISRIIRPERFMDNKEGKKHDIVELDCNKATASCIKIQCEIYNIPAKSDVNVHVKARLWNTTLVTEYPRFDLVRIMSRGMLKIPLNFSVEQIESNDAAMVSNKK